MALPDLTSDFDGRVTINDISIDLRIRGAGPTLLYLHPGDGIAPSASLIDSLARSFRVIAPAHPGFETSDLPRHFSTIDDLAYFYLDFLEELGLEDITLVGASFGGWLAVEIVIKNRVRFDRLVLIDALGAKFDDRNSSAIADIFYYDHRGVRKLLYYDGRADDRDFSHDPEDVIARHVRNREALTLYGWSPLLYDPKLRHRLHRVKLPTLVLWGEDDRVAPVDYGRRYAAALPSAIFDVVPRAGHYMHDEHPAGLARRIRAFCGTAMPSDGAAP